MGKQSCNEEKKQKNIAYNNIINNGTIIYNEQNNYQIQNYQQNNFQPQIQPQAIKLLIVVALYVVKNF